MVGCCNAILTDFMYVGTGNGVGAKGAQALAKALENNSTLTTLNLEGTCRFDEWVVGQCRAVVDGYWQVLPYHCVDLVTFGLREDSGRMLCDL